MATFDELRKRAKSGDSSATSSGTSFDDLRARAKQEKFDEDVGRVDDSYITLFLDTADSYLSSAEKDYGEVGFSNAYQSYLNRRDRLEDLEYRRDVISKYLENNRDSLDEDSYNGLSDTLSRFGTDASKVLEAFSGANDYYSQWDTEEEYRSFVDWDEKRKFDLGKGQEEISALEKQHEDIRRSRQKGVSSYLTGDSSMQSSPYAASQQGMEIDPELADLADQISQKKQYLNQAKHIQEGITLSSVTGNADFEENSGYVSTHSDNWWDKLMGGGYDATYEYINDQNGFREEYKKNHQTYSRDNPWSDGESTFEEKGYDYLNDNEIAIYNYHYAKDGKEAAEKYLDSIQETLNQRKATGMFAHLEDKTALELAFGVAAGLDQFESGVKNLFSDDDYIAQTATQMASGMVRDDLKTVGPKLPNWLGGASLGQVAYDATTTTANMAPSVLSSIAANILLPGSGAVVGNSMMFASSAGNAYQEALNLGYDKSQARAYSTLVGASEAGLQYLLGGISSLGGKVSGGAITKMLDGIDNAFLRTAVNLGGNMLSEGLEEGLQEVLTPLFKEWSLRTDEDINWSEVAYSALLGALTAGVMEGPSTISGEVSTYQTGKQLQEGGITAQRLSEIGSTFAADTVAYQLAGRVDENTGAYTMGRLFNEIGATLTEQNVNDITQALVQKGMSENVAKQNARAMAMVVEGGNLSDAQVKIIEANEVLAEAVRTTIIDSNATWFQRTKGYNEALMALAQEKTAPKATVAEQVLPGQENADATDIVDAEAEVGSEADYEAPKVQSISSIEKGVATIKLEDGSEVSVREAGLDPDDGVRIEAIASIEGISTEDANYILGTLRAAPGATAQMDSLGAKEAYKYGYYGFSQEHIAKHGVFANSLSESQRQAIYETGRAARQRQVEKATPKTATVAKNATTGKVHFDGDRSTLTERQSTSLTAMEKVADALGVQIYVFESKLKNGKRIGANGWYDPKDGSIHIDLHAGAKGEGTMMFTLAHELTHHIRQWSPAKFKALADFLMQEYGKKGVNVDGLVREQMAKAKRGGRTISYDTAYEEVVADSMETMLADGKVMEKLAKLKVKDKSLWNKIKKFIHKLAAKIRSVYEGLAPDSVEGRYVAEMVDSIEKLQELFTEGLVDASKNYQAGLTPGKEGVVANQKGEAVAYSTEDGSVLLSMRTYEEDGREALRDYLTKCVSSKKLTQTEMDEMLSGIEEIYQVCKEFKDKYAPFSSWSDAAVVRNTRGKPVFSVVTPNGDYKMNLDFSLVCKKRRTLDAVFNEMSRRGIIDDFELGQKSVVKINEIIRKYGLETACALCFVDAKRFRQASMADSFVSRYNELVESLVPEDQKGSIDHFNFSGYDTIQKVDGGIDTWDSSKLDFSHINHVLKTYGNGTVEYKAAKYIKSNPKGRKLLLRGDFMSSQGFDAVKTRNQDILKLYNSKKGTGGPKAAFGDVQYLNEVIQKARWWTPAKAYAVGGVRVQSFSDYVPRMVFDYVQMVYDLAATKLPAHAYTKEAQFVKQFGLTGIKINMSLIPAIAEGGVAPGLDANGNYVWAGESFDFETAKEIQNAEGYTENCGTICVGVSDRHIRKLLSDPDIRMVIPYHKSGLNPIVAHMNKIAEFTDYTNDQNTTVKETGSKAEKHFDFNKALHDMGENADPRAVIQQYFDWCEDNGYVPKFAAFRDHPNYYKLIEDFTLFDKDGRYVPQHEVRAVFPKTDSAFGSMKKLIEEGLQEDAIVEGKRDARLNAIVDEIQQTLPKTEAEIEETQVEQADRDLEAEVKLSDRDSNGKQLGEDQLEYFEKSEVRDRNGNLQVVYHGGTVQYEFDTSRGAGGKTEYGPGGYFTESEFIAKQYSWHRGGTVKEYYLNIERMFDDTDMAKTVQMPQWEKLEQILQRNGIAEKYIQQFRENGFGYMRRYLAIKAGDRRSDNWAGSEQMNAMLREAGFDGVKGPVNDSIQYVIFTPNQAKLTTNEVPSSFYDTRYSERDTDSVSNRSLLANALDGVAQNDIEKRKIEEYKGKISLIEAEEKKLSSLNAQIKKLSFSKGKRDTKKLSDLRFEAQQAANRINTYDRQLLRLEASKPLQDVLTREKKMAYQRAEQKGKEALAEYKLKAEAKQSETLRDYRETRAALRQQKSETAVMEREFIRIVKAYEKLDAKTTAKSGKDAETIANLKAALKEEAKKHKADQKTWETEFNRLVREYEASGRNIARLEEKIERQKANAKAKVESREKTAMRHKVQNVVQELNDLLLNESKKRHVPDNLKKAVADALALVNMDTVGAEERAAKYANLIAKEQAKAEPDQAKIDAYTASMDNILNQGEKMGQRLKDLRDAYEEIQNSDDPDIAGAYDPMIAGALRELAGSIGNTSIRDMSIEQLSDVYDMYRMVLTRVRDANKAFLKDKSESISNLASRVVGEVRRVGGEHKHRVAILDPVKKFLWNNLKPVYAMEHIGSAALTEVYNGVRAGEDTWAKDVTEARAYYLEQSKKYGYDGWDFKKKYRFESDSGIEFELTLEQILSLYAYSKREQAHDHLRLGGFVFDSNIETFKDKGKLKYKVNTADAHQITAEILADIIGKLSDQQKGFVDSMQEYLSTTMGAKGNEVTMAMYGVKLFKEKFYFPLKSAKQFMFEQNEVSGEVRIKNSGFTNKTVAKANNPVILSNFMDVWAGHVNDMSMYHAFVLPLEDFNRVFNYNSPKREGQPPVSVKGTIQSAYGPAAVSYVKNLITDLNGGARTDSTTGIINKMMGLFKKGSVFASLSVVVQQPSAIARAAALVDTKYFIGPKVDHKRHKALWNEVKLFAPVAIIKEMGYFDTNMGKSTQDFIMGKEYSGFKDKMKALVTDSGYRDEVLSKAPALADEIAWCAIWEAVKRETQSKNKGMDVKSEAFMKKAGERFTEVITKTQVYDSVLSRSANMRSKDTGMKMVTAFMAEPTTSINMIADALLKGKRGNRKYARATIGAVIASQIFNSILVSFVYAGRDDDEDETYWEKYLGTLSGEILDSMNPLTYIPFVKDIVSIAQGYDVERSDMAIISDVMDAYKKLKNDNLSTYRKVEGFAGSIAQIFGLPLKNIMRDARGIYQTVDSFMGGQQTTKAGIGYAVKSAVPEWLGGGEVKDQHQLYEAILNGDQEHLARVKARYKDEDAVSTAIRKALRENDPRIREAAEAQMKGDPSERVRIAKLIIADGFSQDDVVRAINAEINALTADPESSSVKKEKGFYTAEDFAKEIANGDQAAANAAKTDIIRTAEKNGKTAEEAQKSFNSSAKSELKELFLDGKISEEKTISALVSYCGVDEDAAVADVQYWAFKQDYPDVYADDSWFDKYCEEVADSGISIDQYMEYRNQVKDITGEGKKERRMAVIDSLPISDEQKDALYYAEGWAESKLSEAPWH